MRNPKEPRESAAAYRRIQKAATGQTDNELAAIRIARLKAMRREKWSASGRQRHHRKNAVVRGGSSRPRALARSWRWRGLSADFAAQEPDGRVGTRPP